ncbi:hypothetical protein JAO73_20880 [Hymenobacter sp. BT523]|uniref:hypothetical protein n=1 Tax=Hymenobacter sp. BT523 TaxID=2795725 RepID=UPI0018EA4E68|nr:hypothetical protein [Hymenobacter sp. BT523]MBJ6111489.1 hypothetical protein [Hymenobacter sp. BT523]
MEPQIPHLQLVFLSSTVTSAWSSGWAFTATTAPQPHPAAANVIPARMRLAVIAA